eukprot:3736083-Rhodomonas_salina.3
MTELSEEAHRSAEQEISLRDLAALSAIWSLLLPRSYKRSGAKDNTVLVPSLNICALPRAEHGAAVGAWRRALGFAMAYTRSTRVTGNRTEKLRMAQNGYSAPLPFVPFGTEKW